MKETEKQLLQMLQSRSEKVQEITCALPKGKVTKATNSHHFPQPLC